MRRLWRWVYSRWNTRSCTLMTPDGMIGDGKPCDFEFCGYHGRWKYPS